MAEAAKSAILTSFHLPAQGFSLIIQGIWQKHRHIEGVQLKGHFLLLLLLFNDLDAFYQGLPSGNVIGVPQPVKFRKYFDASGRHCLAY